MNLKSKVIRIIQEIILFFSSTKKNVVIIFVPGKEFFSGGILSLFYLFKATKKILNKDSTACYVCTLPYHPNILHYTNSGKGITIFNYFSVLRKYRNANKIMLQVGESFVWDVAKLVNDSRQTAIETSKVHINVLNLNMDFMPPPIEIDKLRRFSTSLTITAAHVKYTEKSFSVGYGTEFTHLCPWFVEGEIVSVPFDKKKNILLVSHDPHEKREAILNEVRTNLPDIEIVEMPNMKFEDYLKFQSEVKWTLTFGEGLDGYLVHSSFTGGVCLAVNNSTFFTEEFAELPNIFESFDMLQRNMVSFIKNYSNPADYTQLNNICLNIIKKYYSPELTASQLKILYHDKHGFELSSN